MSPTLGMCIIISAFDAIFIRLPPIAIRLAADAANPSIVTVTPPL
jgi:hypothetical protein